MAYHDKKYSDFKDGDYLQVFIPAMKSAMVFRVVTKTNPYSKINYGALPLPVGTSLASSDTGAASVASAGVRPARSYTQLGSSLMFTKTGSYDNTDMWYTSEEYRDRIFYIVGKTTPSFLQMGMEYPRGVQQYRFQRDNVQAGVGQDFGFARGILETIQFPTLHQGWRFGNDSYMPVNTQMQFMYNELIIQTPQDPQRIYDVLMGNVPSRRIDLPIAVQDPSIPLALRKVYGYTGFDTTVLPDKTAALAQYATDLQGVII